jgi:hypothetical protein
VKCFVVSYGWLTSPPAKCRTSRKAFCTTFDLGAAGAIDGGTSESGDEATEEGSEAREDVGPSESGVITPELWELA